MAGFIKEKISTSSPIVKKDFKHALCTGETGSGKTTGFMLPNIEDRIKNNYGMLIIDVKGSLHSHVKVLAGKYNRLKDVEEFGVAWGTKINIFKNVEKSLFLDTLNLLNGEPNDKFWITSALNIAGFIYDTLAIIDNISEITRNKINLDIKYSFNAETLNLILESFEKLDKFILDCELFIKDLKLKFKNLLSESSSKLIELNMSKNEAYAINQFANELNKTLSKLSSFSKSIDKDAPAAASGGVFLVLKNLVNSFSQDLFNGENELKEMLEEGKVVVFRSNVFDEQTTIAIMNILYKRLLIRDNVTPVALFVDEFQKTINKEALPHIDLFREMNVELIAAMQNLSQLESKLGDIVSLEFLGNVIHNYEFANHLDNTLETFEFIFHDKKMKSNPIFTAEREKIISQIRWQNSKRMSLPLGYVYVREEGHKRVLIQHIRTKQTKYQYMIEGKTKYNHHKS